MKLWDLTAVNRLGTDSLLLRADELGRWLCFPAQAVHLPAVWWKVKLLLLDLCRWRGEGWDSGASSGFSPGRYTGNDILTKPRLKIRRKMTDCYSLSTGMCQALC